MAGLWTARFTGGATDITIASKAAFEVNVEKNFSKEDEVDSIDWSVRIRGEITGATPADVADGYIELHELVTQVTDPVRVRIALDGTDKFDLDPAEGFTGPHVISIRPVADEGAGHEHWTYELVIVYRGKPSTSENDLYNFSASFTKVTVSGRIIRQVWRASGTAKTKGAAEAAVLAYKPSEKNVSEDLTVSPTESSASAVWVWEPLQRAICRVRRTGAKDFAESGQIGVAAPPVLHRLTDRARIVTVGGTVFGRTEALTPPAAHFTESDNVQRVDARETDNGDVYPSPAERGIYALDFQEVWLITGPIPAIKHDGNHHLINLEPAPAPGRIIT